MTDYYLLNLKVFKSNNDVLLTNMLNRNRNIIKMLLIMTQ